MADVAYRAIGWHGTCTLLSMPANHMPDHESGGPRKEPTTPRLTRPFGFSEKKRDVRT